MPRREQPKRAASPRPGYFAAAMEWLKSILPESSANFVGRRYPVRRLQPGDIRSGMICLKCGCDVLRRKTVNPVWDDLTEVFWCRCDILSIGDIRKSPNDGWTANRDKQI